MDSDFDIYKGDEPSSDGEAENQEGSAEWSPKLIRSLSRAGGLERSAPHPAALRRPEKKRHCCH